MLDWRSPRAGRQRRWGLQAGRSAAWQLDCRCRQHTQRLPIGIVNPWKSQPHVYVAMPVNACGKASSSMARNPLF